MKIGSRVVFIDRTLFDKSIEVGTMGEIIGELPDPPVVPTYRVRLDGDKRVVVVSSARLKEVDDE